MNAAYLLDTEQVLDFLSRLCVPGAIVSRQLWLLASGYWRRVTGVGLLASGYWHRVTGVGLQASGIGIRHQSWNNLLVYTNGSENFTSHVKHSADLIHIIRDNDYQLLNRAFHGDSSMICRFV